LFRSSSSSILYPDFEEEEENEDEDEDDSAVHGEALFKSISATAHQRS